MRWLSRPTHGVGPAKDTARAVVWLLLLVVAGCAIKLAPDYDKTIVESLTAANEKTLVLFATLSTADLSKNYPKREPSYNELIGQFDAIVLQAKSRPVPRPLTAQIAGLGPPISTPPDQLPVFDQAPTIAAAEEIVQILTRMRDLDRAGRLNAAKLVGLKTPFELQMNVALTYEKALQR